jgi:hypothetical protein
MHCKNTTYAKESQPMNPSIFQTPNRALTAKPEARSSFGEVLPDISGSIVEGNRKRHNPPFYQRVVSFLLQRAKRLELSTTAWQGR